MACVANYIYIKLINRDMLLQCICCRNKFLNFWVYGFTVILRWFGCNRMDIIYIYVQYTFENCQGADSSLSTSQSSYMISRRVLQLGYVTIGFDLIVVEGKHK